MARRSPARRPRKRRPSKRQRRERGQLILIGLAVAGVVGFTLVSALVSWLSANPWVLIALGAGAVAAVTVWAHRRRQALLWERTRQQGLRYGLGQLDALHHRDFEYAVRDLMRRDGCDDARQIGGAGDNGADVLATDPLGRTWVIQCKHRKAGDKGSAVGTPDLQRVNGCARQLYGADVVLVVTNGRFSARCAPLAAQLHMHLADRRTLAAWAGSGQPLWELLAKVPRPRRSR
ncbi:restriction endonuclease (plasmid) [Streptomyces sp. NBC_01387]|uniref:restriction endonuclease n=1 Tax=unclassified Streptomyces TaxID=2593676 RepID=UPI002023C24F|nr:MULTISPECIES: restriction endonuclease [unclassified Streptomyces]MCX4554433.1 restriction endonuclease [Streptomyces sp. NBC_01500]WSV58935.1 restriction endonuclease [Streptomyces sp. NBC_01014]